MSTTPAEETRRTLLERAANLVPVLRQRASEAEQLRQIPQATVDDLRASELVRLGNPERFGGHNALYRTMFDVSEELARGCPSTAWCYAVWSVHNWWVGHFPEEAQLEFFGDGPDVLSSSTLNPRDGQAEPAPGGYRVSGHWTFSSGCDAAAWAFVAATGPDGPLWALLPRKDYRIVDDWYVAGMRGTGSKDIVATDVFVPAHRTLDPALAGDQSTTGWDVHHRRSYRAPMRVLTGWDLAAPIIGMAQGAIDAFTERYAATSGTPRSADAVSLQLRVAEAAAAVRAAHLLHRGSIASILAKAEAGEPFSALERAAYARDKAYTVQLSVQAVNRLYEASGGRGAHDADPMQRFHRDIHVASHHGSLQWDLAAEDYGRQALGLPSKPWR